MTETQQKKLTNGEALLISKGKLIWVVVIWLLTQAILFGIWKGTTDTVLQTKTNTEQVRHIVKEELQTLIPTLNDIKEIAKENRKDIKELIKK